MENIYDSILDRLLIIFKSNYNHIVNDSDKSPINYSLINIENNLAKNKLPNTEYNEEYLINYIKNIFKLPQKKIILDYFDINFKKIKKMYTKFSEDTKIFVYQKKNLSLIHKYNDNDTFNIKIRKSSVFTYSFNESLIKPMSGNSINYKEKRYIFNDNLSNNLKKIKNNNKNNFNNLSDNELNNKNKLSNYSESFEDANNTNQLFLKDNSNILSKLNINKNQ